jgi:methionyl aminopeptidase
MRKRGSIYKSPAQLRLMLTPGLVTAASLSAVRAAIRPGVTTLELDAVAESAIRDRGAVPNFMKEPGYRHTICTSVNDDVVHGIPGGRVLEAGDIVSIDSGAEFGGWNGDAAFSVVVPDPARPELVADRRRLVDVTEQSLWHGIAALSRVSHLNEVGAAIEDYIDSRPPEAGRPAPGYGILEDYVGHGIGRSMHEDPPVFNYRVRDRGPAVKPGLVVAIEPMVTQGGIETFTGDDGWTVTTSDGSMAAHWEHSIAVHADGIWVLTAEDGGAAGLAPLGVTPVPIP